MEYNSIISALLKDKIAEALPRIFEEAKELKSWKITEEIDSVWNTYKNMLEYAKNGIFDPEGEKMRVGIVEDLINIVYDMWQERRVKDYPTGIIAIARQQQRYMCSIEKIVTDLEKVNANIDDVKENCDINESKKDKRLSELYKSKESTLSLMYWSVFLNMHWKNADVDQANRLLFSDNITTNDKCVFIGAVMMSLMFVPDKAKLLMLLDCYLINDIVISQRALVSFIIAHNISADVYEHCKEIGDRLAIYKTDSDFVADLNMALMQMQMTVLTEKATKMFRENVMPNMFAHGFNKPNTRDMKIAEVTDIIQHGENSDWILDDTMLDVYTMMREGIDMNYSAFVKQKNEDFFKRTPHWFYLFSIDLLRYVGKCKIDTPKQENIVNFLSVMDQFCDSDKYTMSYLMMQMPALNAEIEKAFSNAVSEGVEDPAAVIEELKKKKKTKNSVRRRYIQDLYRFFYAGPHYSEYLNPFFMLKLATLTPLTYNWTEHLLGDHPQELKKFADFLKRYEFYDQAIGIYERLATNEVDSRLAGIWQKIGFCYENLVSHENALHAYIVANDLKPNSEWTLCHIAGELEKLGRDDEAVQYYKQLLEISPDNEAYMANMIEILNNNYKYEEALSASYKLSYISEEPEALLGLVFILLALGRTKEGLNKLKNFTSDDPSECDKKDILVGTAAIINGSFAEGYAIIEKHNNKETASYINMCFDMLEHNNYISKFNRKLIDDARFLRSHSNLM